MSQRTTKSEALTPSSTNYTLGFSVSSKISVQCQTSTLLTKGMRIKCN